MWLSSTFSFIGSCIEIHDRIAKTVTSLWHVLIGRPRDVGMFQHIVKLASLLELVSLVILAMMVITEIPVSTKMQKSLKVYGSWIHISLPHFHSVFLYNFFNFCIFCFGCRQRSGGISHVGRRQEGVATMGFVGWAPLPSPLSTPLAEGPRAF